MNDFYKACALGDKSAHGLEQRQRDSRYPLILLSTGKQSPQFHQGKNLNKDTTMKPLCFVLMPFGRKPDTAGRIIDFDTRASTRLR